MKRSLRRFLRRRGATDAEIENAVRGGYLSLLVLDREVMPGARVHTMAQLATRAGTDVGTARTLWRSIGFPDLPDNLPVFTEADVEALRAFIARYREHSVFEWTLERALPQARVLSSSLARVADAETDDLAYSVAMARESGLGDEALAELFAERLDFDGIAGLVDHTHRLQLRSALWRRLAGGDPNTPGTVQAAVGFVDLVRYTALAQMLDDDELATLLRRFGDLTHDTVVGEGGRIVKTIGDEIMYVTDTPRTAAGITLGLVDQADADDVLPEVRAGVTFGPVLSREGDYFGPVVNLASRLTELARPGTVLVSAELASALDGDARFYLRRIPSRRIRDIGRVEVYRLEPGT